MKKITMGLVAVSFLLAKSALAAVSAPAGFYVEGNVGESFGHISAPSGFHSDENGLAGNVNLGYKFNPYLAAEAGYTQYATSKFNATGTDGFITASANARVKQAAMDLAIKGILPIEDSGFELFGKLGVARIQQNISTNVAVSDIFGDSAVTSGSGSQHSTNAYYGVGAQYAFTSNVIGNVQFTRAQGNSDTGSLDLASAGISYLFG